MKYYIECLCKATTQEELMQIWDKAQDDAQVTLEDFKVITEVMWALYNRMEE